MTGAGSATLAFGKESSFLGSVTDDDSSGNPSYYSFGRNPTVQNLSLDNQLQRMREAGTIESVESVKQGFEGAFAVQAVVNAATFDQVEKVVFNDSGSGFTTGRAQPAEVLAGVEHLANTGTNTKIRALKGVIPTDFEISYQEGGMVTYTLTCIYADEQDGSSPTDLTTPTGGDDAAFHDFSLDIDGTTVSKLQSATLSFSTLYKFHRGASSPTPVDAVLASPETSLNSEAIYEGADRLELAYGSAGVTTPQDRLSGVSATADITVDGTAVSTYNLSSIKPATYDWNSLLEGETDTTDPVSWHVNGGVSVA